MNSKQSYTALLYTCIFNSLILLLSINTTAAQSSTQCICPPTQPTVTTNPQTTSDDGDMGTTTTSSPEKTSDDGDMGTATTYSPEEISDDGDMGNATTSSPEETSDDGDMGNATTSSPEETGDDGDMGTAEDVAPSNPEVESDGIGIGKAILADSFDKRIVKNSDAAAVAAAHDVDNDNGDIVMSFESYAEAAEGFNVWIEGNMVYGNVETTTECICSTEVVTTQEVPTASETAQTTAQESTTEHTMTQNMTAISTSSSTTVPGTTTTRPTLPPSIPSPAPDTNTNETIEYYIQIITPYHEILDTQEIIILRETCEKVTSAFKEYFEVGFLSCTPVGTALGEDTAAVATHYLFADAFAVNVDETRVNFTVTLNGLAPMDQLVDNMPDIIDMLTNDSVRIGNASVNDEITRASMTTATNSFIKANYGSGSCPEYAKEACVFSEGECYGCKPNSTAMLYTCPYTCQGNQICRVSSENKATCGCDDNYIPVGSDCVHENLIIGLTAGIGGAAFLGLIIAVVVLACSKSSSSSSSSSHSKQGGLLIDDVLQDTTTAMHHADVETGLNSAAVHDVSAEQIELHEVTEQQSNTSSSKQVAAAAAVAVVAEHRSEHGESDLEEEEHSEDEHIDTSLNTGALAAPVVAVAVADTKAVGKESPAVIPKSYESAPRQKMDYYDNEPNSDVFVPRLDAVDTNKSYEIKRPTITLTTPPNLYSEPPTSYNNQKGNYSNNYFY